MSNVPSLEELQALQKQTDQEIQQLSGARLQLVQAAERYTESKSAVTGLSEDLLVPVSDSVYVKGKLATTELMIDIGTNYFARVSQDEAVKFFDRKQKYLQERRVELEKVLQARVETFQQIQMVLQQQQSQPAK